MSGRIPRERQGRWHDRRGRGSRGPTRGSAQPLMPLPLPDEVAPPEEFEREPSEDGSGGLGDVAR